MSQKMIFDDRCFVTCFSGVGKGVGWGRGGGVRGATAFSSVVAKSKIAGPPYS